MSRRHALMALAGFTAADGYWKTLKDAGGANLRVPTRGNLTVNSSSLPLIHDIAQIAIAAEVYAGVQTGGQGSFRVYGNHTALRVGLPIGQLKMLGAMPTLQLLQGEERDAAGESIHTVQTANGRPLIVRRRMQPARFNRLSITSQLPVGSHCKLARFSPCAHAPARRIVTLNEKFPCAPVVNCGH